MTVLTAARTLDLLYVFGSVLGAQADEAPGDFDLGALRDIPLSGSIASLVDVMNEPLTHALSATLSPSYIDDFYNRVHIFPRVINLGNLQNNQVREVEVWNAFFTDETINAITAENDDGLNLSEPVALPYTLPGLNSVIYELTITTEGPGVIDAEFLFDFDSADLPLIITGVRVVIFEFAPDWEQPVNEMLGWKTRIITSKSGKEQRAALLGYQHPRRDLDYAILLSGNTEAAKFESVLWGYQDRAFALPIWCDQAMLLEAVEAGETTLSLLTDTFSFYEGGTLLLKGEDGAYETLEIDEIAAESIALNRGTQFHWPAGTRVYPINTGRLPTSIDSQRVTDQVTRVQVHFEVDPIGNDPYVSGGEPAATYEGKELLQVKPDWVEPPANHSAYFYGKLDSGIGARAHFKYRDNPEFTYRYHFTFETREQEWFFRQFLGRRDGQRVTFWMSSWMSDFAVAEQLLGGATQLICEDNGYAQFVGTSAFRRHLHIETTEGTFLREIEAANFDPETGQQQLALSSALGVTLDPHQFLKVSFLGLWRGAEDKVAIRWRTDGVAELDLMVRLVDE
jgi:hypothetical protein